jgi:hypothetical protein
MKMGHILFTSIIPPPKGFATCWTALYKSILNSKGGGQFCQFMWPSSLAITGHQRDVQGIYMVLNAREPAIYAKEWTLGR